MEALKQNRLILTNLLVNQFLKKNDIEPEQYIFRNFVSSYVKENSIKVVSGIPDIDEEFFLGVTVRSKKSICIFLNPQVYKRRIHFSSCHEVAHCIFDMNMQKKTQQFFNVDNNPSFYSESQLKTEKLANGSAGVIMLPDIKIVKYMASTKSFHLIADECLMSKSALYNRLMDFAVYSCNMSSFTAINAVKTFQNTGDRSQFRMSLSGAHSSCEKQIIYDFENAI